MCVPTLQFIRTLHTVTVIFYCEGFIREEGRYLRISWVGEWGGEGGAGGGGGGAEKEAIAGTLPR